MHIIIIASIANSYFSTSRYNEIRYDNHDTIFRICSEKDGTTMISFEPFWHSIRRKGISQYSMIHDYHVSPSMLHKLRHDLPMNLTSIDDLCKLFDFCLSDVCCYIPDPVR